MTTTTTKSVEQLRADVNAAEHAASQAMATGDYSKARALAVLGRLRMDMVRDQTARTCRDCNGYGRMAEPCPPNCAEHDEPGRTGRHWRSCDNVVSHPNPAAGACLCNLHGVPPASTTEA